jgi:regulatory protein YycH of two-component signal transduction system YycFG
MKYENVKSLVLLLLVAISGVLTLSLWTYKPKYEFRENRYVHEVSISEQENAVNLLKPSRVLFHLKEKHYGTVRDKEINELIDEISSWNFYDIGEAKTYTDREIQDLSHSDNRVVISYPDLIPFDLYKGVIHVETQDFPNAAFNRIVINLAHGTKEESSVYFISTSERKVYESHINPDRLATFLTKVERNKNRYDVYGAYQLPGRTKFLPAEETKLTQYKFYSDSIDPVKFKNALFSDPSFVRRDMFADGEKFTDGSSLMDVDYSTNMIFYINPAQEQDHGPIENDHNLLRKSINFVNEHGGWTDNYRYFNMGEYERRTIFQLSMDGYPVFNEKGMTEIRQDWGANEIQQYKRPYFMLDFQMPGQIKITLPSGENALTFALEYLQLDPRFDPDKLEDMIIGYKLEKDVSNSKVLNLDPSWYCLYAGSWVRLPLEDMRGEFDGLE